MQYKKLGRTGLKISEVGLGTMSFGYPMEEADAVRLMKHAFSKGINFVDTAWGYNDGKAEEIVGKGIKGERDKLVVATKFGGPRTGPGANEVGASRKNIMSSVEASLRLLDTDYIDIYFLHWPDYDTPIEETLRVLDDLIQQGKVRYAGCCNFRAFQLCKALWVSDKYNLARFETIQTPLNLLTRDVEYELLPLCDMEEVGVMAFNPTAAGLLTGKLDMNKQAPEGSRFADKGDIGNAYRARYWTEANFKAVEDLKKMVEGHGKSLGQFAIAWSLKHESINTQLLGADSIEHFDENLGALDIEITKEEQDFCDQIWKKLNPPRFLYGR